MTPKKLQGNLAYKEANETVRTIERENESSQNDDCVVPSNERSDAVFLLNSARFSGVNGIVTRFDYVLFSR